MIYGRYEIKSEWELNFQVFYVVVEWAAVNARFEGFVSLFEREVLVENRFLQAVI